MSSLGKATRIEPHRLRVCSVLHEIGHDPRARKELPGIPALVFLLCELERRRKPPDVDFALTFTDLLAMATFEIETSFEPAAVRALIHASGEVPIGAHVRLPDGRFGIVLDESTANDPLRPSVLVGSEIVVPERAVTLVSPTTTTTGR